MVKNFQVQLASFLLLCAAAPFWIWTTVIVSHIDVWGAGVLRYSIPPIVLVGVTAAVHRLLREIAHAWAISALTAGLVCIGALQLTVWLLRSLCLALLCRFHTEARHVEFDDHAVMHEAVDRGGRCHGVFEDGLPF